MKSDLKNFSSLVSEKAIKLIFSLIVNAAMARTLGPEKMGQFFYCFSIWSFCSFFISLGLDQLMVHSLVTTTNIAKTLNALFSLRFLGTLTAILAAGISFIFLDPFLATCVALFAIQAFGLFLEGSELWVQSKQLHRISASFRSIVFIVMNILKLALLNFGFSIKAIILCTAFENIFSGTILFFYLRKKNKNHSLTLDFKQALNLFRKGAPLFLSAFLVLIYSRSDQILLGKLSNFTEAGIYGAAQKILEYINILPMLVSVTFFPSLSALSLLDGDSAEYFSKSRFLKKRLSIFISFSIIFPLFAYFFAPAIIQIIFGKNFTTSSEALRFLVITIPFTFFGVIRQAWMTRDNELALSFKIELTSVLILILFFYIFIPKLGAKGAGLGYLCGCVLSHLIILIFSKKSRFYLKDYLHHFSYIWKKA
jgi:O-antigen/teichoic acid export membrane protein